MTIPTLRGGVRLSPAQVVRVSGLDAGGRYFTEQAEVLSANAQGCSLVLKSKLLPDHELHLSREGASEEVLVRVVRAVPRGDSFLYELRFVEPRAEAEPSEIRFLLTCEQCRTQSYARLNRSEAQVLQTAGMVTRLCLHCGEVTLWKRAEHEPPEGPMGRPQSRPGPAPRRGERRRRSRARMNVMALVRRPGFGEEVVKCVDLSRDGMSFLSTQRYPIGQRVEVTAPYDSRNPSPPLRGRIVYVLEQPESELLRYGVQYLKPGEC